MFTFGKKTITLSPLILALLVGFSLIAVGLFPLAMKMTTSSDLVYGPMGSSKQGDFFSIEPFTSQNYKKSDYQFLGYKESSLDTVEDLIGPYGLGASILSLCIPLGIGLMFGLYYKYKTRHLIKIRESSKQLEQEFSSSLFQLGNRLGDGLPAEIAFERVSQSVQGTVTGDFFSLVSNNIQRLGLSVKDALFGPSIGAVRKFPSNLIESSMKVLTQASEKGPKIAAQALMNISRYVKEIHRVDERLRDLMADIISSMRSQINFLSPVIAAVVIGITSMVTSILSKLKMGLDSVLEGQAGNLQGVQMGELLNMFGDGVPTYFLQIVIGTYVVQLIFLLTLTAHRIENGSDRLGEQHELGKALIKSTITYVSIALVLMVLFTSLSVTFLKQ